MNEISATQPLSSNGNLPPVIETCVTGGMSLTVSEPLGTARAGIVLLHEIWGVTDGIKNLTARLAACGYITAAPHLYHRVGSPVVTDQVFNKARRYHDGLTAEGLSVDLKSALEWIRAHGVQKVAIVGFSILSAPEPALHGSTKWGHPAASEGVIAWVREAAIFWRRIIRVGFGEFGGLSISPICPT